MVTSHIDLRGQSLIEIVLEQSNFHVYNDLSQSLYDHFPEGTDKRVLSTERELQPFEYPVDDGQLSQYVDDFLCSEDADCGVFTELLEALRFKPSPPRSSKSCGKLNF